MTNQQVLQQLLRMKSQLDDHAESGELHEFIEGFHEELRYALSNGITALSEERKVEHGKVA